MNEQEIVERITASWQALAVTLLAASVVLFLGFRIIKLGVESSGGLGRMVGGIIRTAFREVAGGPNVRPHERINGFVVLMLGLLTLTFLLLLIVQTVRGFIATAATSWQLLAAFLACLVMVGSVGLLCVRVCAHHEQEMRHISDEKTTTK